MSQEPSEARPARRFVPPEAFDEPPEDSANRRSLVGPLIFIGTCLLFAAVAFLLTGRLQGPDAGADLEFDLATPRAGAVAGPDELDLPRAASGRLTIGADLPEGSWIEIDGEPVPALLGFGSPLRLSVGAHRVVVRAAGYHPWTAEIEIPAHTTVRIDPHLVPIVPGTDSGPTTLAASGAPGERVRPPTRRRPSDPEPSSPGPLSGAGASPPERGDRPTTPAATPTLPEALLDSLALQLEQGRVLQEIERYAEAEATFRAVIDRATSAAAWPYSARLAAVKGRADSALAAIRRSCEDAASSACE